MASVILRKVQDIKFITSSYIKEDFPTTHSIVKWLFLQRRKLRLMRKKAFHTIQVTSFGGVGTSFFYKFLSEQNTDIPNDRFYGIWKHQRIPPGKLNDKLCKVKQDFKAVYLFGNPMDAVISLFQRNYQIEILQTLLYPHVAYEDKTYLEQWNENWGLEQYLDNGKDLFRLEEHFRNWAECPREGRSYPIMLVKYETMWSHLPELFAFLGMPSSLIDQFPEKRDRNLDWTKEPNGILAGLGFMRRREIAA